VATAGHVHGGKFGGIWIYASTSVAALMRHAARI
jgi:hypothetical protein